MKYRNVVIFLGFVIVIVQFLGFPQSWDEIFYIVAGALIIAFGYVSGRNRKASAPVVASEQAKPEN